MRKGIFAENKADACSKKSPKASKSLYQQAEVQFEKALEYLDEAHKEDASLEMWFDRNLDFSADGDFSLSKSAVPRSITTRSLDGNGGGLLMGKQSKLDIKIEVVEQAIENIEL